MDLDAYFISPEGVVYFVPNHHIALIYYNTELFGFTQEQIREIYAQYDEPIPAEGKARNEIIAMVLMKGWIRIRFKLKNQIGQVGHFQFAEWSETNYNLIKSFNEQYPQYGDFLIKLINLNREDFFYDGWKTINQFFCLSFDDSRKLTGGVYE